MPKAIACRIFLIYQIYDLLFELAVDGGHPRLRTVVGEDGVPVDPAGVGADLAGEGHALALLEGAQALAGQAGALADIALALGKHGGVIALRLAGLALGGQLRAAVAVGDLGLGGLVVGLDAGALHPRAGVLVQLDQVIWVQSATWRVNMICRMKCTSIPSTCFYATVTPSIITTP